MKSNNRIGRPTKQPKAGERMSLGLKVTADIKQRIDEAARNSGRTQSQEAELRLEHSFRQEDLLSETLALAYDPRLAGLLMMMGRAMHDAGHTAGFLSTFRAQGAYNWTEDSYAFDQAVQAAMRILEAAKPAGSPTIPEIVPSNFPEAAVLGVGFANSVIDAVNGRGGTASLKEEGFVIRGLLGPVAKRIKQGKTA